MVYFHSLIFINYPVVAKLVMPPIPGYLYNFQTKEFFNLSYAQEPPKGPARFGGLLTYAFDFHSCAASNAMWFQYLLVQFHYASHL